MSEYQYYEFRAVDRLLTDRQMRELRAISTRAAISRTSFSNQSRERAEREREEQAARDRHLIDLAKRERQAWQQVDALIGTKRPADYTAAVNLLVDLRDLSGRKGRDAEFTERIRGLREAHAKKPSLLGRLRKAGL